MRVTVRDSLLVEEGHVGGRERRRELELLVHKVRVRVRGQG